MRAIVVSALVGLVHIYHDELWALVLAPLQTLYHLVAALFEGEAWLLVVVEIGVGVTVVYLYIRASPIEYGSTQTLALGGQPDGFATKVFGLFLHDAV